MPSRIIRVVSLRTSELTDLLWSTDLKNIVKTKTPKAKVKHQASENGFGLTLAF